jgi:hypothetical protein
MSTNPFQQARKIARVRRLFAAALVLGCALGTVTNAAAQKIASPKTPDGITPVGNTAFLEGHAFGTQGYTCLPTSDGGTAWNTNARPEATLFVDFFGKQVQIITHFASIDENPNDFAPKPVSTDRCRHRRELPEYRGDSLSAPAVSRKSGGAHGRQAPCQSHLRPTTEHQGRSCSHNRLLCGPDSASTVHG